VKNAKKLIAILLALVMVLSCTAVLAEETSETPEMPESFPAPDLSQGMTVECGVKLDAQAVAGLVAMTGAEVTEETASTVGLITNVVNELGVRAIISQNGAQADVSLKDSTILSITGSPTEEGLALALDALPEYVFTVKNETIQAMLAQVQSALPEGVDMNAVMEAVLTHVQALTEGISAKIGEAETGEYEVNGLKFTTKVPVNITTKEIATMLLTFVKGLASDEAVSPLLAMGGEAVDLSSIDSALESIENTAEEEMPATDAALYTNEQGDGYLAVVLTKEEESMALYAGSVQDQVTLNFDAMGARIVDLQIGPNGDAQQLSLRVNASGMIIAIKASVMSQEDGAAALLMDVCFNSETPIISLAVRMIPGGEVAAIDLEGKTFVALDGEPDELGEAFYPNSLVGSVAQIVMGKAAEAMPEEIGAIMQLMAGPQVTEEVQETVVSE